MSLRIAFLASLLLSLGACASWTTPAPRDQPYFAVEAKDAKAFQTLAGKQDLLAAKCAETNSCDHVYFTRALLGLYESRDTAEQYFRKVVAVSPKSHLAASSKAWLQLLHKHSATTEASWGEAVLSAPALAEANTSLTQATDRLVRELLSREFMGQPFRGAKDSDLFTPESLPRELSDRDRASDAQSGKKDDAKTVQDPTSIVHLRKQIADRDKKIAELSSKLEALKRIDQEMREKVRPIRPPAAISPAPSSDTPQQ